MLIGIFVVNRVIARTKLRFCCFQHWFVHQKYSFGFEADNALLRSRAAEVARLLTQYVQARDEFELSNYYQEGGMAKNPNYGSAAHHIRGKGLHSYVKRPRAAVPKES